MTEQQFDRNTWQTPKYVFHWLNLRFKFDIDGCANGDNALVKLYFGDGGLADDFLNFNLDALKGGLSRASIFVNPPYSNVTPFIKRAKALCNDGHLVVMLLNNDKSTQWYQNHIHGVANEVIDIVGGRIAFIHPATNQEIKGNSKGQMIVVFDPAMQDFVQRSVSLDFIKKVGGYDGK
ncbi:phage N-6-adenine-methyltransferase [uncultured Aggregatibacter sp.]|uniref:phage N-6-adenine-methyltransferase n=1 Tax=uncultured Aggregatibacter sp. TaxID=470564 RepID=UPI001A471D1F|nr:phage N-6-adenine-methyltransferase [uncultured Aggregatibacter sp.]VTX84204.1 DNA N-6-adenine-methyltransferase (Dam) [uncultured Aggregatibacter sp.]